MFDLAQLPDDIQGLIFDCDGTLVDTPPLYAQAWDAGFEISGRVAGREWYRSRAGMSEHVLMDAFEASHGVTVDRQDTVRRMRAAFIERLHQVQEISVVCDVARRNLGRRRMAVASGGSAEIVGATLKATGLAALFDTVVTIDDVGRAKPDPALFLEAANRLGLPPAACLVFEDSREGLEAAERAGMRAVDVLSIAA